MTLRELINNLKPVATTKGGEYALSCPFCGGKDRFRVWPNESKSKGGSYWCRQCRKGGDGIQFVRETESLSFPEALERLGLGSGKLPRQSRAATDVKPVFGSEEYKVPDQGLADKYHGAIWKNPAVLDYLKGRNISEDSIRKFKLGFISDKAGGWLSIPHFENGRLVNIKFRSLPPAKKTFKRLPDCRSVLFNADVIRKHPKEVIVTEGELDAITLDQAGFPNVVSGTTGCESFAAEWIDQLKNIKRVLLAYDPDEAGQKGTRALARRLGYGRTFNITLPEDQDVNEFLSQQGREWEFMRLMDEARPFDLPGVVSMAAGFDLLEADKKKSDTDNGLKTPWSNVNALVKGFQPGDLIVLTAMPKTGKTTLALNISQGLAKQSIPCLFYCLEMRPERLMRKIVQAEARKEHINLTDIQNARGEFSNWPLYFAHSFKKEKLSEILSLVREAIRRYDLQFVVFDNLHFLIRSVSNVNEELGQAVQGFKLLAEEMEVPILALAQPRKKDPGSKGIMSAEDIKYSNSIHADCDLMVILHRERKVSKASEISADGFTGQTESLDPVTLVRVEAHRYGPGGETVLYLHGEQSRFDLVEMRRLDGSGTAGNGRSSNARRSGGEQEWRLR